MAMSMYARRAEGLLAVDGKLWVETAPPAFVVSAHEYKRVTLQTAQWPEWFTHGTIDRYFPLTKRDEAVAYATALARSRKSQVEDLTAPIGHRDHPALEFDAELDQASRLAGSIAIDCEHTLRFDRDTRGRQDATCLAAVETAMEGLRGMNYVLGRRDDLSALLPDLFRLWNGMGRPRPNSVFGVMAHKLVDTVVERAMADIDHRPIDVFDIGLRP